MYLQSHRLVRAEDAARHFEVSLRTIYRDVSALSEAGVPVSGEAGLGYSLVKGYYLPPVSFTADEAMALFMGAELVKRYGDASLQPAIESSSLKIRAALPRDRQDEMERMSKLLLIDSHRHDETGSGHLVTVRKAMLEHRLLSLSYQPRDKESPNKRSVEALGLVFGGDHWYLVAWCRLRKGLRHFRLDRIQSLELLREHFTPRDDFSLKEHLEGSKTEGAPYEVLLKVGDQALDRMRRESYTQINNVGSMKGSHEIRLRTYSLEWVARWVLSFGAEAEVLEPPHLRALVCKLASEIAKLHREK
jgi:predicted DNA-binding transcriptional regulator YafY